MAALAAGLKVDVDMVPPAVLAGIRAGTVNLNDPANKQALIAAKAVVGVMPTNTDGAKRSGNLPYGRQHARTSRRRPHRGYCDSRMGLAADAPELKHSEVSAHNFLPFSAVPASRGLCLATVRREYR